MTSKTKRRAVPLQPQSIWRLKLITVVTKRFDGSKQELISPFSYTAIVDSILRPGSARPPSESLCVARIRTIKLQFVSYYALLIA